MSRTGLLLSLLAGAAASATPIPSRLVYDASGTSCPGKDQLVSGVSRRLGTNPFDNAAPTTLMVQVTLASPGLKATLVRMQADGSGTGRRELSSRAADCRELFQAIELEVALAIDPLMKPAVAPVAPVAPPPPPAAVQAPALAPARPISFAIGDGPSDTPVNRMTRPALVAERAKLETNAPNSGLPFILGGGGGVAAGTMVLVLSQTIYSSNDPAWAYPAIGTAMIVAGLAVATFGIVMRLMNLERIELFGMRMGEIDSQLELRQRTGADDPGPPVPQPAVAARRPVLAPER